MPTPESINPAGVTLAVLAGGAGTRMGMPKALLRVGDEAILSWLLRQIGWPGPTLLITAPSAGRPPGADAFDAIAVDAVQGNGPLQGVLAALQHSSTDIVVVTTVDMPNVTRPVLQWLVDRLLASPLRAVMSRRKPGDAVEPFPSAWHRSTTPLVEQRLSVGRRSVHGLVGESIAAVASPPGWPDRIWLNLNTPADFAAFLNSLPPT